MVPPGAVPFQCSQTITNSAAAVQLVDTLTGANLSAVLGRQYFVSSCVATNRDSGSDTNLDLLSNTTRIFRQAVAQAGGGFVAGFSGPPKYTAVGEALKAKLADAISGDVHVDITGYYVRVETAA